MGSPWGPRQPEPYFENQTQVFSLSLQPGNRSPFLPDDELEAEKKADAALSEILTEGIAKRLSLVPVPAGNYSGLKTDGKKLFLLSNTDSGANLVALAIRNEDIKLEPVATNVSSYELSADSKKVLIRQGNALLVFDASGGPDPAKSRVVLVDRWSFSLDPKEGFVVLSGRTLYGEPSLLAGTLRELINRLLKFTPRLRYNH
ncbi:hypothetical protein [Armatimonas sp.]|uniref:hypothetical protein n=1 Tax=Armatimonas sp. TaxID=1872638 RepID=UPI0037515B14